MPSRGWSPKELEMTETEEPKVCRILSLDGGGAKGFYTLGVLRELEGMLGCRLHERFEPDFRDKHGSHHRVTVGARKERQ